MCHYFPVMHNGDCVTFEVAFVVTRILYMCTARNEGAREC